MTSRQPGSRGFTIPELLIVILVSGLMFGAIATFVISSLDTFAKQSIRAGMLGQTQIALDSIERDIRLSASADAQNRIADANAPDPANDFSWSSNGSTLILATAAQDPAGNILFADPAQYISHKNNTIYFTNASKLFRRTLAAGVAGNTAKTSCPAASATPACRADTVILEHVKTFSIKYFDADNQQVAPDSARSIELDVTVERIKADRPVSVSHKTRTVFRND